MFYLGLILERLGVNLMGILKYNQQSPNLIQWFLSKLYTVNMQGLSQLFYELSPQDNLNSRCNSLLTWFRCSQILHSDINHFDYHKLRCMCICLTNLLSGEMGKNQCKNFLQRLRLSRQDNLLLLVLPKHTVSKTKIILSSSSSFFFFLFIFSSLFLFPLFILIAFSLALFPTTVFYLSLN